MYASTPYMCGHIITDLYIQPATFWRATFLYTTSHFLTYELCVTCGQDTNDRVCGVIVYKCVCRIVYIVYVESCAVCA